MVIANNRFSHHLLWNENLMKHQKVSKYYENDSSCLKLQRLFWTANLSVKKMSPLRMRSWGPYTAARDSCSSIDFKNIVSVLWIVLRRAAVFHIRKLQTDVTEITQFLFFLFFLMLFASAFSKYLKELSLNLPWTFRVSFCICFKATLKIGL